jgi:hypothetical protein
MGKAPMDPPWPKRAPTRRSTSLSPHELVLPSPLHGGVGVFPHLHQANLPFPYLVDGEAGGVAEGAGVDPIGVVFG